MVNKVFHFCNAEILYCLCFFTCLSFQAQGGKNGIGLITNLASREYRGGDFADTNANKKIVIAYLNALKNFDHLKMKSFIDSSMPFPDKTMKGYRDFEKNMDTRWQYRVLRANGDSVFAEEKEENMLYDCLGVGERVQVYCYLVKDSLIFNTVQISMHHLHGEYKPAYTRFLNWLKGTDAKNDSLLLQNNALIFDGESAVRMKPWLRKWKKTSSAG